MNQFEELPYIGCTPNLSPVECDCSWFQLIVHWVITHHILFDKCVLVFIYLWLRLWAHTVYKKMPLFESKSPLCSSLNFIDPHFVCTLTLFYITLYSVSNYPLLVLSTFFLSLPAIYNFDGKVKLGLPLNIGDTVQIIEECQGKFTIFCMFKSSLFVSLKSCIYR